jgi:hypothetical protein
MEFKKEHFSAVPLNIGRPIGDFMKKRFLIGDVGVLEK